MEHLFYNPFKTKRHMALGLILMLFGMLLFIGFTLGLGSLQLASIDEKITNYVISYRSTELTNYFIPITRLGDAKGYILVLLIGALIYFLRFKNWKHIAQTAFILVFSSLLNIMLKTIINRPRPDDIEYLVMAKGLSYPSGHAMAAASFYGFLIYLFWKAKLHLTVKIASIFLLACLILSIGISRVYLGVHFPSDIIAGYVAGATVLLLCIVLFQVTGTFKKNTSAKKREH